MDVLNSAVHKMLEKVPPEKWKFVGVAVAPSTITISEHGVSTITLSTIDDGWFFLYKQGFTNSNISKTICSS